MRVYPIHKSVFLEGVGVFPKPVKLPTDQDMIVFTIDGFGKKAVEWTSLLDANSNGFASMEAALEYLSAFCFEEDQSYIDNSEYKGLAEIPSDSKLWVGDDISVPICLYQDNDPGIPYIDQSSSEYHWDTYGQRVLSFSGARNKINNILIPKLNPSYPTIDFSGWSTATQQEKDIACKWIIAPYSLRITHVTEAKDIENWDMLVAKTKVDRYNRVERMRIIVSEEYRKDGLTKDDSDDFLESVSDLMIQHIEGNTPDLKQWISNEVGSLYETDGFAEKTYYSETLKNDLLDSYAKI